MFDHHLASDLDVYATSASNDSYSSFACYFDKTIGTYLGDVYSIMWLQVGRTNTKLKKCKPPITFKGTK